MKLDWTCSESFGKTCAENFDSLRRRYFRKSNFKTFNLLYFSTNLFSLSDLRRKISVKASQSDCSRWKLVLKRVILAEVLQRGLPEGPLPAATNKGAVETASFCDPSELLCVCSWKCLTPTLLHITLVFTLNERADFPADFSPRRGFPRGFN